VSAAGRVAVVTGGAGGIGAAICVALLESGHRVVSVDRTGSALVGVDDVAADLAARESVQAAADLVLLRYGRCDVLVHAAADFARGGLDELDLEVWRRVQAVNVESLLLLSRAFAPGMADRAFGRIVSVVSDTVYAPPAGDLLAYVASKAALIGVTRTLAVALGPGGISVTAVAPGLTATEAARAGTPAEAFRDVAARQALARPLVPRDVASVVAFLVSDAAGALTGQTLCVDGGLALR
jgi:NAD(P)-dependent dehydrogenase (short-subunit alcohol dehydrogenase family)